MAAPHAAPWTIEGLENAHGKSMKELMNEARGKDYRRVAPIGEEPSAVEEVDAEEAELKHRGKKKAVKKKREACSITQRMNRSMTRYKHKATSSCEMM